MAINRFVRPGQLREVFKHYDDADDCDILDDGDFESDW